MLRPIQSRPIQAGFSFALATVFLTLAMHGQTGPSAPATAPVAMSAAPSEMQSQSPAQVTTLRAYSNLVVVDVVVSDSKKNPVHGLQKSDFALLENSKPQVIRSFEEHTALPASETLLVAPAPKMPAGLFSNRSAAPANGPVNVLLLDYLNTELIWQVNAKKQLIDYLDKAPAGTRIAIFGLTTHLNMLQGFTSDMSVLKAVLTAKKGAPQVSDVISNASGIGSMDDVTLAGSFTGMPDVTQEMMDDMNRVDAQLSSETQDMRAKYTLNAFDQLARYLVGIPGRKNVIWFSGGFPLDVEPNANERDPNDSVIRNDDEVRKTDNLLTRAQIAVYPVDARGVQADTSNSVTNLAMNGVPSSDSAATATMGLMQQIAQEHETMDAMAEDTGGEAYYNTNGLAQAVTKAIENGSNYYTLTYTPSNLQWDERFRTIKINVAESGVKLNYRNGYYAVDPNDRNRQNAQGGATALAATSTMSTTMMHGGPDPTEILFKVRIRPSNKPAEAAVLTSNRTNPDPKVKVGGPYKQYGVDLVPDPHAVNCRAGADGNRHCALEIWTYVYDRNGQLLVTTGNALHTRMTPEEYNRLLTGGMAFHQQVSVPVKGEHFLRTAIHDLVSDRVGAVEIPVAAVVRLDPLKEIAGGPAAAPDAAAKPVVPATQTPAPAGSVATP